MSSSRALAAKTWVVTLVVVLTNVVGNLFLSLGLRHSFAAGTAPLDYIVAIFRPWVLLGIALLIVWVLTRMTLLSWADLSFVLPVTAIGYALSAMAGRLFLNEQVTPQRWAAVGLIVAGAMLVAGTTPTTTNPKETQP